MAMLMKVNPPKSLFGIICLSSAVGLLLYWVMFMNVLPRLMRPEALTILPLMSGVVGAASCALIYLGISDLIASARPKPKAVETLVLRRGEGGRVVSIGWAGAEHVIRARAPAEKGAKPVRAAQARSHSKAKYVGVAALVALVLGGYASMMFLMGYTLQDVASGMCTPFMAVSSQSMQPALNYGDLIIVRRETAEGIAVGDVIAFNVPSPYDRWAPSPTVHRVVEKLMVDGRTFFKTKGDNNPCEDPWIVPAENVIGKYAGKIPYVGFIVLSLRSPLGLALAAFLIALASIYPYSRRKRGGENP